MRYSFVEMRSLAVLALLISTVFAGPRVGMKRGDLLLDVKLPTADGKFARVSDFLGKKLIVIHFASW